MLRNNQSKFHPFSFFLVGHILSQYLVLLTTQLWNEKHDKIDYQLDYLFNTVFGSRMLF